MNDRIIGIIGGMGPEATADFYLKIIKHTKAKKDQDHFRVIIDSNPKIPDRTKSILNNSESPVKRMKDSAQVLEKAGVDIACITCITAHYYIEEVQKNVSYPIINAIYELKIFIRDNYPNVKKVGIIGTTGTMKTKIFDYYLKNIDVIYPNSIIQEEKVMKAIYGIKENKNKEKSSALLREAGNMLIKNGAEVLIFGCTEVALVLNTDDFTKPVLDPMEILCKFLIT